MIRKDYLKSFVISIVILTGCTNVQIQSPLHKTDFKQLEANKDSYAGDNSAMGAIADQLPHREWQKGFEIQDRKIIIDYKNDEAAQTNSTFTSNLFEWKKEALTAAVFYSFIPQNVDAIMLRADGVDSIEITKTELEDWLKREKINIKQMKLSTLVDYVTEKDQVENFFKKG